MTPFKKIAGRWRKSCVQWAALLVALLILGLLSAVDFYADFRHHREQGFAELADRAALIERNVEHQLETIHFALGNLQAAIADPDRSASQADLRHRLEGILDSLRGVRTLSVFDAEGTMLISNRPEFIGANFAYRDYFSQLRAHPDPATLHVSPPFRTSMGVLTITASRAIVNRAGKFTGVVSATLEPEFFIGLLQSGRTSEDTYILLSMDDRTAFVGLPDDAQRWLHDLAEQDGMLGKPAGQEETHDAALPVVEIRGEQRAVAVRWAQTATMAPDNRIKVLASRNLAAIEHDGYHDVAIKLALCGAAILIGIGGLLFFQRRQRIYRAERAQQEQALRASEKTYHSLIEHMLNGFAYCRMLFAEGRAQDFIYLEVNPAFETLTGLRKVEGKRGSEVLPGLHENDPQVLEIYARVALTGQPERHEIFIASIDAWLSISVCSPHAEHFFVIFDDISEQQRAQRELEQASAKLAARTIQAEEASAAKTRFLSSVSHELRTPLHTILGYVRLLLKETAGETRRQLVIVERSGAQLLKLIDELLEFNLNAQQTAELQPEAVELRELLRQLEHTGQLMARAGDNHFSVSTHGTLPGAIWVDEQRLLQVLQNLLGNACKYTRNGTVSLCIARDDAHQPTLQNELPDERCRLRFSVEDSGAGIAAADQERIFDAFNRGAAPHGQPGLGLGLAIARQWVRAMGSDIQVHSAPGQGSRFSFRLELPTATYRPHRPSSTCAAFRHTLAATPRTILVIDDIAENRLLLRDLCESWGFNVVEAATGEQALTLCKTAQPAIDAVLVDQFMPGMDGWGFLQHMRQIPDLAQLPAVLISASAALKPAAFPSAINFDLLLGKPLDEQALACFFCQRLLRANQAPACCRYPTPTIEAIAGVTGIALAADELANFRQMLDLGRVLGIEKWAQELSRKDSTYNAFAEQVVQHCRAGDLAALEKLAAATVAR